ncbi:MAG: hypothetical protein LBM68_03445 [Bacteroidales bacterium]|nr:hypothetical protein [Bacteroidales bacterium]
MEDENSKLKSRLSNIEKTNSTLRAENAELRNRKLNIAELKHILDLGLIEVDTNLTRTWNEQFKHENKTVRFIGALQVEVIAQYGINLKELRFKEDAENNIITVANINPKFLSFKDLNYSWKISEILEYKQPTFAENHWGTSTKLQELCGKMKEDLRLKTHEEVKNGPQEMKWLIKPLEEKIINLLNIAFGKTIKIVATSDDSFKALGEYKE